MPKFAFVLVCLAAAECAWAQGQFGSINGHVKDETGAVVPGVDLRVVNAGTGVDLSVVSDDQGRYLAPQLLPGTYNIVVRRDGFKQVSINGLKLDTNGNLTQDIVLTVGAVADSVQVSGQTALVDTVTGSIGHIVNNKSVLELPLNGRAAYNLVALTPGSFVRTGAAIYVSIGGGRTLSATSALDGVVGGSGGISQQTIGFTPSVDALQEYRVEANSFSAQYGRSNAGIINATTKSGTNEFHGVLYWFVRNDAFDSRGWNSGERASLRRNTYGGSIGGPIRKNKTFFFYNLEGLRERRGVPQTRTVPLAAWRSGDLSTLQRAVTTAQGVVGQQLVVYDPAANQQQAFAGNRIPASRQDAVALNIIKAIPAPNRAPDNPITQQGNYQEAAVTPITRDVHTMRVDHTLSTKSQIFGRYMVASPSIAPLAGFTPAYGSIDPNAIDIRGRSHSLALSVTHIFSPSTFLSARVGGARTPETRSSASFGENWPEKLGLKGVGPDSFPRINLQAGLVPLTNIGTGGAGNVQYRFYAFQNLETQLSLTKIAGAHTLKFGGTHMRISGNDENRQSASGIFGFGPQYTTGRTAAGGTIANTGSTISDLLLGRPDSVTLRAAPMMGRRIRHYAGYFEDDYRVASRLTFNLGVRYELESPFFEVNNRMSSLDPGAIHPLAGKGDIPAGQLGALIFPGRGGRGRYLANWDKNNIAPRFGFAWRPTASNETVVRGGVGLFYGNPYDNNVIQTMRAGFEGQGNYAFPVPFTLAQGVPAGALVTPPESELTGAFGARGTAFATSSIDMIDPQRRTQYSINYNLTVQRQWREVLFEASYFANLGRKVPFPSLNVNQIPTALLSRTDIPERLKRPYTQFSGDRADVNLQAPNFGLSNYHALGVKVDKRFSKGFGLTAAYTFSKWIDNILFTGADDATWGDNDGLQNIYDLRNERSLSTNHIPHRLVLSPIWELPFGKGKPMANAGGWADWLIGGWQVSTIATMQAGSMFGTTVTNGARDILGDAATGRVLRPNLSANPNVVDGKGQPAQGQRGIAWFNPAVFSTPARFTPGNAARTIIQAPGLVNFDFAMMKNFRLKERYRLQFRWEAFNATNTPFFEVLGDVVGQGNFGVATAGNSKREMQFALKLYF
ncbi:MAG: carboxypeptidase regulatory-like domain-containing protein [Candidatus Solibacter usitatus]|nr:carboxypeptidase regulatory-like domain-containing protein [Candidatus Solibacter usitatus]